MSVCCVKCVLIKEDEYVVLIGIVGFFKLRKYGICVVVIVKLFLVVFVFVC